MIGIFDIVFIFAIVLLLIQCEISYTYYCNSVAYFIKKINEKNVFFDNFRQFYCLFITNNKYLFKR